MAVIRAIDWMTAKIGVVVATILVPIILLPNVYEVFSRYVLRDPTVWALDVTTYAFGSLFMLVSAWALLKGAHVRTDILWDRFADRTKGIIDSCAFLILFLPTMAILTWSSWDDFIYSMSINEKSSASSWMPVIWPLRAAIPFSCGMLFLQGLSELMKSLWAARTGHVLARHEKIEV
jgi:TRAP-type mannitol/chloroaromatic compound transport system permease small subunit